MCEAVFSPNPMRLHPSPSCDFDLHSSRKSTVLRSSRGTVLARCTARLRSIEKPKWANDHGLKVYEVSTTKVLSMSQHSMATYGVLSKQIQKENDYRPKTATNLR